MSESINSISWGNELMILVGKKITTILYHKENLQYREFLLKLKLSLSINVFCHHKNCRSVVGPQPVTLSLSYGLYIGDKWASDQNYRTCYKSIIASSQTKPVIFYIQHHLWPISHHTSLKEKLSTLIHTIFSFPHDSRT